MTLYDDEGGQHSGDLAILCPGAAVKGLAHRVAGPLPVRPVRLQMAETAPLAEPLPTALADADSFRYYPAYAGPALERLRAEQPQVAVAAAHRMQLLAVQRLDGGLTIGDTHAYDEPFGFAVDEEPYNHLVGVVEALLAARCRRFGAGGRVSTPSRRHRTNWFTVPVRIRGCGWSPGRAAAE